MKYLIIMKWSRYSHLIQSERNCCYFLYNTMSNYLAKVSDKDASLLMKIKDGTINAEMLPKETYEALIHNSILVYDDKTELAKLKLLKQYNRMDPTKMVLTIAPTLECNLRCSYCFEDAHPAIRMSDAVEDAIVEYVRSQETVQRLKVTWFGGEPSLYFERIESITSRLKQIPHIKQYSADIITNGVELDREKIEKFDSLCIDCISITIDGLESVHNSRRGHGRMNSFQKIMENLEILSENERIIKTIRVNIDKSNLGEFKKVYSLINSRFAGKRFNTYIGFVKNTYGKCNQCVHSLTPQEQVDYLSSSFLDLGKLSWSLLPLRYNTECMARQKNGLLVDPEGFLYKCWTDTGNKEMSIGNILNMNNINIDLLAQYLVGADPFDSFQCQKCSLLPLCGGGCPHARIMNSFFGKKNSMCHMAKGHLVELVDAYYEILNKQNGVTEKPE